jgi:hypothetical protein
MIVTDISLPREKRFAIIYRIHMDSMRTIMPDAPRRLPVQTPARLLQPVLSSTVTVASFLLQVGVVSDQALRDHLNSRQPRGTLASQDSCPNLFSFPALPLRQHQI